LYAIGAAGLASAVEAQRAAMSRGEWVAVEAGMADIDRRFAAVLRSLSAQAPANDSQSAASGES
jgi:hypothetical protein